MTNTMPAGDNHATARALPQGLLAAAALLMALLTAALGANRYAPGLSAVRDPLLPGLIAIGLMLAFLYRPRRRGKPSEPMPRWLSGLKAATFVTALLSLAVTTAAEARFQSLRREVLSANPDDLARLGRHIIIGIDEPNDVAKLIEHRAVSGIFVTQRNVKGKSEASASAMIARLNEIADSKGGAPLWVTADQEGGIVQRLSPPLPRHPSLSELIRQHLDPLEREKAIRAHAAAKGHELARIGVNVNFSPVVDIDFGVRNTDDKHTRIWRRAISSDPAIVADAARWYCEGLWSAGVRCTRKHFPGLGRVFADTHIREATLTAPLDQLASSDWVPFQSIATRPDWVMIGHMRVTALDPERPASASPSVMASLRGLGHAGIVITDDFSMGAIWKSSLGIGEAAVAALNAGVDIVLISYDSDQVYRVLHALLRAEQEGRLDRPMLEASDSRLALALRTLMDAVPAQSAAEPAQPAKTP